MKPFLKWAGGKTQLLPYINDKLPLNYNNYYEPFLGGGSVLFNIAPEKAFVGDSNNELINVYQQIRNNPDNVLIEVENLDRLNNNSAVPKDFYYKIRAEYNSNIGENSVKQAAKFIYLNKHCFNGLYRVNSKGQFNVPFNGKSSGGSIYSDNLIVVSEYLNDSVSMCCGDYKTTLQGAKQCDFVFLDPPYDTLKKESFTGYTKNGFNESCQIELANEFKRLSDLGVFCMLTNHNTPLINDLYKEFNISVIPVKRNINRDGNNRVGEEVIVTNY